MKVLHAAETIKGGVATVINSLIEHQKDQAKVEHLIALIPSDQADNLIAPNTMQVYKFKRSGRGLIGMLSFFLIFLKIIILKKPDVVHLHSSFAGLIGRFALLLSGRIRKTKVIYCPHAFGFLMQISPLKKRIYGMVEIFLSKLTDKIICVSNTEYNAAIEAGFQKNKLITIHNGVQPKTKVNEFTCNNKKKYKLLFVGRFDYQKGIDILLEAFNLLSKKDTNIFYEVSLVGESVNNKNNLKFTNAKNIQFNVLGWLKPHELERQYLSHDVLIIPSRWEGFAMVPLESMSYGLPVIASNIDSFKELEDFGSPHMIFFDLDPVSLFQCLMNINNFNLKLNSENALHIFKKKYSNQTMNNKTFDLYNTK